MKGEALIYRPGQVGDAPAERRAFDAPPDLKFLREAVGGYIEHVPHWDRLADGRACAAFCNEEGKLKELPINMVATLEWKRALVRSIPAEEISGQLRADVLVGTVVVLTGDDEFMKSL